MGDPTAVPSGKRRDPKNTINIDSDPSEERVFPEGFLGPNMDVRKFKFEAQQKAAKSELKQMSADIKDAREKIYHKSLEYSNKRKEAREFGAWADAVIATEKYLQQACVHAFEAQGTAINECVARMDLFFDEYRAIFSPPYSYVAVESGKPKHESEDEEVQAYLQRLANKKQEYHAAIAARKARNAEIIGSVKQGSTLAVARSITPAPLPPATSPQAPTLAPDAIVYAPTNQGTVDPCYDPFRAGHAKAGSRQAPKAFSAYDYPLSPTFRPQGFSPSSSVASSPSLDPRDPLEARTAGEDKAVASPGTPPVTGVSLPSTGSPVTLRSEYLEIVEKEVEQLELASAPLLSPENTPSPTSATDGSATVDLDFDKLAAKKDPSTRVAMEIARLRLQFRKSELALAKILVESAAEEKANADADRLERDRVSAEILNQSQEDLELDEAIVDEQLVHQPLTPMNASVSSTPSDVSFEDKVKQHRHRLRQNRRSGTWGSFSSTSSTVASPAAPSPVPWSASSPGLISPLSAASATSQTSFTPTGRRELLLLNENLSPIVTQRMPTRRESLSRPLTFPYTPSSEEYVEEGSTVCYSPLATHAVLSAVPGIASRPRVPSQLATVLPPIPPESPFQLEQGNFSTPTRDLLNGTNDVTPKGTEKVVNKAEGKMPARLPLPFGTAPASPSVARKLFKESGDIHDWSHSEEASNSEDDEDAFGTLRFPSPKSADATLRPATARAMAAAMNGGAPAATTPMAGLFDPVVELNHTAVDNIAANIQTDSSELASDVKAVEDVAEPTNAAADAGPLVIDPSEIPLPPSPVLAAVVIPIIRPCDIPLPPSPAQTCVPELTPADIPTLNLPEAESPLSEAEAEVVEEACGATTATESQDEHDYASTAPTTVESDLREEQAIDDMLAASPKEEDVEPDTLPARTPSPVPVADAIAAEEDKAEAEALPARALSQAPVAEPEAVKDEDIVETMALTARAASPAPVAEAVAAEEDFEAESLATRALTPILVTEPEAAKEENIEVVLLARTPSPGPATGPEVMVLPAGALSPAPVAEPETSKDEDTVEAVAPTARAPSPAPVAETVAAEEDVEAVALPPRVPSPAPVAESEAVTDEDKTEAEALPARSLSPNPVTEPETVKQEDMVEAVIPPARALSPPPVTEPEAAKDEDMVEAVALPARTPSPAPVVEAVTAEAVETAANPTVATTIEHEPEVDVESLLALIAPADEFPPAMAVEPTPELPIQDVPTFEPTVEVEGPATIVVEEVATAPVQDVAFIDDILGALGIDTAAPPAQPIEGIPEELNQELLNIWNPSWTANTVSTHEILPDLFVVQPPNPSVWEPTPPSEPSPFHQPLIHAASPDNLASPLPPPPGMEPALQLEPPTIDTSAQPVMSPADLASPFPLPPDMAAISALPPPPPAPEVSMEPQPTWQYSNADYDMTTDFLDNAGFQEQYQQPQLHDDVDMDAVAGDTEMEDVPARQNDQDMVMAEAAHDAPDVEMLQDHQAFPSTSYQPVQQVAPQQPASPYPTGQISVFGTGSTSGFAAAPIPREDEDMQVEVIAKDPFDEWLNSQTVQGDSAGMLLDHNISQDDGNTFDLPATEQEDDVEIRPEYNTSLYEGYTSDLFPDEAPAESQGAAFAQPYDFEADVFGDDGPVTPTPAPAPVFNESSPPAPQDPEPALAPLDAIMSDEEQAKLQAQLDAAKFEPGFDPDFDENFEAWQDGQFVAPEGYLTAEQSLDNRNLLMSLSLPDDDGDDDLLEDGDAVESFLPPPPQAAPPREDDKQMEAPAAGDPGHHWLQNLTDAEIEENERLLREMNDIFRENDEAEWAPLPQHEPDAHEDMEGVTAGPSGSTPAPATQSNGPLSPDMSSLFTAPATPATPEQTSVSQAADMTSQVPSFSFAPATPTRRRNRKRRSSDEEEEGEEDVLEAPLPEPTPSKRHRPMVRGDKMRGGSGPLSPSPGARRRQGGNGMEVEGADHALESTPLFAPQPRRVSNQSSTNGTMITPANALEMQVASSSSAPTPAPPAPAPVFTLKLPGRDISYTLPAPEGSASAAAAAAPSLPAAPGLPAKPAPPTSVRGKKAREIWAAEGVVKPPSKQSTQASSSSASGSTNAATGSRSASASGIAQQPRTPGVPPNRPPPRPKVPFDPLKKPSTTRYNLAAQSASYRVRSGPISRNPVPNLPNATPLLIRDPPRDDVVSPSASTSTVAAGPPAAAPVAAPVAAPAAAPPAVAAVAPAVALAVAPAVAPAAVPASVMTGAQPTAYAPAVPPGLSSAASSASSSASDFGAGEGSSSRKRPLYQPGEAVEEDGARPGPGNGYGRNNGRRNNGNAGNGGSGGRGSGSGSNRGSNSGRSSAKSRSSGSNGSKPAWR